MSESDTLFEWPKWMPLPQQSDYGYSLTDRRSKTDMEVGSILRVNFDTDEGTVDCSIVCNCTQALWLENFEQRYLKQGATWFKMPLQTAGAIDWHTVRFASRLQAKIRGPKHTTYTFKLEFDRRDLWLCEIIFDLLNCMSPQEFMGSYKNIYGTIANLKKLQKPDWECWKKEFDLKYNCPSSVLCSESAINVVISNLKKLSKVKI